MEVLTHTGEEQEGNDALFEERKSATSILSIR